MARIMGKGAMPIKFRKHFQGGMAALDITKSSSVNSKYAARQAGTAISANLFKAVRLFKHGRDGQTEAFVGIVDDGRIVSEIRGVGAGASTVQFAVLDTASGKVEAQVYEGGNLAPYILADGKVQGRSGTLLLLALLAKVGSDAEGKDALDAVLALADKGEEDSWSQAELDQLGDELALLGDNIYRRLGFNFKPGDPTLGELAYPDLLLEPAAQISPLAKNIAAYTVDKTVVGTAALFTAPQAAPAQAAPAQAAPAPQAEEDILEVDLGSFGEASYSDEEKEVFAEQRRGVLATLRQVSTWMSNIVYSIVDSFEYDQPKQTFGLFGPAGCGKSFGTAVIAQMLKLVRIIYGCQPDTDIVSLFGTIIPNVACESVSTDDIRRDLGLPTEAEIMADVEGCAARLGLSGDASEAEVLSAMASRVNLEAARRAKDFRYEEGPVTRALRNGYLLEIQEAGTIRRPGVLVALNALLEAGKDISVTLPTGEVVKKNPHTIICFTSNDEYEGTCQLNQSVISRMAEVLYFENPASETMAARAKVACKDFPSDTTLLEMAEAVSSCSEFLKSHDITSGVCGQRELNAWAQGAMSIAKRRNNGVITLPILREAAQSAVINKVAQDRESIAEVASAVFNPKFGDYANTVSC